MGGINIRQVRKRYIQLALLVHVDRGGKSDPRSADRSMRTLARAMEIVEAEIEFSRRVDGEAVVTVSNELIFQVEETQKEKSLRNREDHEGAEEEMNQARKEEERKMKMEEIRTKSEQEQNEQREAELKIIRENEMRIRREELEKKEKEKEEKRRKEISENE